MRTLLTAAVLCSALCTSAQFTHDAKILEYTGLKYACDGTVKPVLKIINEGSEAMFGCVVETWKNGLIDNTFDWQLAIPAVEGEVRQPAFPLIGDVEEGDVLEFRIRTVNNIPDMEPEGNNKTVDVDGEHASTGGSNVTVRVLTDGSPEDLTWEIRNDLNQVVASGGPYADPFTTIEVAVALGASSCYNFKALDSGRGVITDASVQVVSGPNTLITMSGADLTSGEPYGLSTGIDPGCTQPLILELRTDGAPEETSWEILDLSDGAVVCIGAGGYQATSIHTDNCCLAEGCYRLRVFDAGGDGIAVGGYVLRTGDTMARIIDDSDNFSSGAESAIAGGQGFCLPIGTDRPIFSQCDKMDWVAGKFIVATENAAVSTAYATPALRPNSGYVFWFYDPNGTYSYRRFRSHATSDGFGTGALRANHCRVNGWSNTQLSPHIPANVLMNVRIKGRVNAVDQEWGPACRFKIDPALAACPRIKLQDNPASNDMSCGVFKSFGGSNSGANRITAVPPQPVPAVSSANVRYQFRFRIPGEFPAPGSCIVRPPQTSATCYLNWTSGDKLRCGTQYEVDVRVSLDGGATWCTGDANVCVAQPEPWGTVCTVNITTSTYCPGEVVGGGSQYNASEPGRVVLYPNPSHGGNVFLSIDRLDPEVQVVHVQLYDMRGALAGQQAIAAADGTLNTAVELGASLPDGVYMVRITAGTQIHTERLVVRY
jgi:hypothetical protein